MAAALPQGWRTGPAWQEINGTRRRRLPAVVGLVACVLITVVCVRPGLVLDHLPGHTPADGAAGEAVAPLPAETALPTGAPAASEELRWPSLAQPFRGSPALAWADGAAGIELPPAQATGGLSRDDVEQALRITKEYVTGTSLDPAVLRGAEPTAALALVDPTQKDFTDRIRKELRKPGRLNDPLNAVSRFDPAELRLAGDVVKVRGHMTFAAGEPGQVRIHADYTFVYPLVRAEGGDETVARTIIRRDLNVVVADPAKWIATKGRISIGKYSAEFFNSECGVSDGWFHPVFPDGGSTGEPATGPASDPYDRSAPIEEPKADDPECGTITRS
ncbi:hypothetical protein [Streptomyces sp. NPDC060184]|uniref:hypothetical protein n=1 Tax=Streptomyces sp. NPDC060184 TaxID=3347064 RepID=UPI00365BDCA9